MCIPARLVGEHRQAVVDGKRVITVSDVRIQYGEIHRQRVRREPSETAANARLVTTVGIVPSEIGVVPEAIALVVVGADPKQERLAGAERTTERDTAGQGIVTTSGELHASFAFSGRHGALHVHESGQRIRAVAGALGTAQHLYALDVERRRNRADAAEIDVVDQETDGRIGRALVLLQFADAADLQVPCAMAVARPVQVRHHVDQFLEVLHRELPDLVGVEDRDARRHLARRPPAEVCRHDDFLDSLRVRLERRRKQEGCGGSAMDQRRKGVFHHPLPTPALPGSGSKGSRYGSQVRRPPL